MIRAIQFRSLRQVVFPPDLEIIVQLQGESYDGSVDTVEESRPFFHIQ